MNMSSDTCYHSTTVNTFLHGTDRVRSVLYLCVTLDVRKNHYFLSQGWIGTTYFFFFVWTDEMSIIYRYIYLIWQLYGKFFCVAVIISNSWKEKRGQSFNFSKFIISILIFFPFFIKRHFLLRDKSWSIHWR